MLENVTRYMLLSARPFAFAAQVIAAHPYLALAAWTLSLLVALWW